MLGHMQFLCPSSNIQAGESVYGPWMKAVGPLPSKGFFRTSKKEFVVAPKVLALPDGKVSVPQVSSLPGTSGSSG